MAYSEISWVLAKSMFEAGKALSAIELETGISKGQISKKSKAENWEKETIKNLAKREVHTIIMQNEIEKEKETLNATQRKQYNEVLLTEIQSNNLALNANHLLLQKIYGNIESGKKQVVMKVKEYSKENGSSESLDSIELDHDSSDFLNLAKAIQTTTDNLGITNRHAKNITAIQVNTEEGPLKSGMGDLYKVINE